MTFEYNDMHMVIDLSDADSMERLENAFYELESAGENEPKDGRLSALMRYQIIAFRRFFDAVFGDGTSEQMFGQVYNYDVTAKAYADFCDSLRLARLEQERRFDAILNKYSPKRVKK